MTAEGELVKEDVYTHTEEVLSATCNLIVLSLTLSLTVFHASKFYSDLFTRERKVLNYRRSKPKITSGYKKMAYLTFISVLFFLCSLIAAAIQYSFTIGSCKKMMLASIIDKFSYFGAKCILYLVFILRLHEVYGASTFGYKTKNLLCIGITIIVFSIALFIAISAAMVSYPVYIDDTDSSYPWFCQIVPQETFLTPIAGVMVLFDVTACISSVIAFIIPLNKVVKACVDNNVDKDNKQFHKMIYQGYMYKILVIVAAISTLSWIVLIIVGLTSLGTIVAQFDFFINPLCLVLMTSYYPSDKYYQRLCILCICCCDRKRNSYKSGASDIHDEDTVKSIDTDIAVQNKVETVAANTDNTNGKEQMLPVIN